MTKPSLDDPHDEWCRRHRWRSPKRGGRRNCPECKAERRVERATRRCLKLLEACARLTRRPTMDERQEMFDTLHAAGYDTSIRRKM